MQTRTFALALAPLLILAPVAHAAPVGVPAAFGATIQTTYPDGRQQRFWLKADGTWTALGRRKKWSSGRWTQKAGKVCFKQSKPFASPFGYCTDFPDDAHVGSTWTSKSVSGDPITVKVIAGDHKPAA